MTLPLDKIMQMTGSAAPAEAAPTTGANGPSTQPLPSSSGDKRARADSRTRDRDSR